MSSTPVSCSQFGEDLLLAKIFTAESGVCLEVGAFDGITGSATLAFERRGWMAVLVEPVPALAAQAAMNRRGPVFPVAAGPRSGMVVLQYFPEDPAVSGIGGNPYQEEILRIRGVTKQSFEVRQRTLDEILTEAGIQRLDFATIDVEGFEPEVLEGFSLERWAPRVVILEDNSRKLDPTVSRIMRRRGYRRFATTGVNDWYAKASDRQLVTNGAAVQDVVRIAHAILRSKFKSLTPGWLKRWGRKFAR